jgi:uncharacterized protein YecT (DUF1311 family)
VTPKDAKPTRRLRESAPTVILTALLVVSGCLYGQKAQSIRDVDWKNFSYPLVETDSVPGKVRWMALGTKASASLVNGRFVVPDNCSDDIRSCPLVTFDSVKYGVLTGIKPTVAAVVLTYHSGGTAHWHYVYLFALQSSGPRLVGWLRTGSRAAQGLREVSITGGDVVLVVNDPEKQQGDCCSAGTVTIRYRWVGSFFSAIGPPVHKIDPPSFDCGKAATPVERLICQDVELSFLDSQMANSYRMALKDAPPDRKEIIRRQQAEWFADYSRTCNAPLSDGQRWDCVDRFLSDRLITIWK